MNNNFEIPVIIFAYNRPIYLEQTLEALKNNVGVNQHPIFVFCDGPKAQSTDENLSNIIKVQQIVENINWGKSLNIQTSTVNKGLANSIVEGVTKVLRDYDAAIIVEDDFVTSTYFLKYMRDSLVFYRNNNDVISIGGFNYPLESSTKLDELFFLKGADCAGWATWRRGWELYEPNASLLYHEIVSKNLEHEFDLLGSYAYTKMLKKTIKDNHSWAIKWRASAFLKQKYTLYPTESLVQHIGHVGTNVTNYDPMVNGVVLRNYEVKQFPTLIEENHKIKLLIVKYFKKHFSFKARLIQKILYYIKKMKPDNQPIT